MNAKDKFVFGVLAALIVGAFYFQYLTDELNMRMDDLNLADKEHVDIVLNEFTDSLRVYNLRFVGRGKHLRKAQKDIVANTELIEKNTDSLASMIDDVSYTLDNFMRDTKKNFLWIIFHYTTENPSPTLKGVQTLSSINNKPIIVRTIALLSVYNQ